MGMMVAVYRFLSHREVGENELSVKWLPKTATNVSYFRSYGFTAYEFDISESDFVKWSSWQLSPIERPVTVFRYCHGNPAVAFDSKRAIVVNGLTYSYRYHNHGGVIVAYDRTKGRAFYWSAPR